MKKRLIILNTVIVFISLCLMLAVGIAVTKSNQYELAEKEIREISKIYADNYSSSPEFIEKVSDNIRITVLDSTGRVIADSEQLDVSEMENHLSREEFSSAAEGTPRAVIRKSNTTGREMIYYAEKVPVGESYVFLRAAMPIEGVRSYIFKTGIPLVFIMLLAVACSVVASAFLCGGVLRPLSKVRSGLALIASGNYSQIPPTTDDDDVNRMLIDINEVSAKLQESITTAKNESEKLDYILNNISDGIVVIDKYSEIVAINRSACGIFGVKEVTGKHISILTGDGMFISHICDCVTNQSDSIFRWDCNYRRYICSVHYTDNDLIITTLTDITAEMESENMRLEFFANASHELKTPLTTIKGFNDMISLKCNDADICKYSSKIDHETQRMLSLIDDMLNLSKLENSNPPDPSTLPICDIAAVAAEVIESLKILAEEKNVKVTLFGEASMRAETEHVYELIKNLTENAIRYNNDGGYVKVNLSSKGGEVTISVSDNGIGIDNEHQSRIFERFYRVDKSRSRATGGTGLGLAIVKHICELYGGKISLSSKFGNGTTVTLQFPEI